MKRHIKGTNNRTVCGHQINDRTLLVESTVPDFMSDCDSCLGRISTDVKLMIDYMKLLHAVCKDTTVLHHVTRLNNQQIKQHAKDKAKWKQQQKELLN